MLASYLYWRPRAISGKGVSATVSKRERPVVGIWFVKKSKEVPNGDLLGDSSSVFTSIFFDFFSGDHCKIATGSRFDTIVEPGELAGYRLLWPESIGDHIERLTIDNHGSHVRRGRGEECHGRDKEEKKKFTQLN